MPFCLGGNLDSCVRSHFRPSSRSRRRVGNIFSESVIPFTEDTGTGSSISLGSMCKIPSSDGTVLTVSSDGTTKNEDAMPTVFEYDTDEIAPNERQVRLWFLQLLEALLHLQKKGVCHSNINCSNILMESKAGNNLVLIDFSRALRIPYKDDSNTGGVADVSQGSNRLLIRGASVEHKRRTVASVEYRSSSKSTVPQRRSRSEVSLRNRKNVPVPAKAPKSKHASSYRQFYTAPEILEGQPFDGCTIDLWSVGVVLYVMLTGTLPFQVPNVEMDRRYRQINNGHLIAVISTTDCRVSDDAMNLLQNMFWRDPRKRLTLNEVLVHPWITMTETDFSPERSPLNSTIGSPNGPPPYNLRKKTKKQEEGSSY
jgi:serine/threonine protein kinase